MEMDELRRRFATLNSVPVPDVWTEVERRVDALGSVERTERLPVGRPSWRASGDVRFAGRSARTIDRRSFALFAAAVLTITLLGAAVVGSYLLNVSPVLPSPSVSPSPSVVAIESPTTSQAPLGHPGWSATGSMSVARSDHTATLLADGTVLVAGGDNGECCNSSNSLATAEIYDPATGLWRQTGSMRVPRSSHTATILPSGKVLVAGGTFDDRASAELYDPATGAWSPAGNMTEPRNFHTATLLANGQVLIAGGSGPRGDANGFLATAELYDPGTNAWTATGNMTTVFGQFHRATLLAGGQVLVVGGVGIPGVQESADLYDPSTGSWSAVRHMIAARSNPGATLLEDGRVLVVGGGGTDPQSVGNGLASAELFDPATGTWTRTGSFSRSRLDPTATLLADGRVLVAGGFDVNLEVVRDASSSELYDPQTDTWSDAGMTTVERSGYTATLLSDGNVLVVGGRVGRGGVITSSAELFNPPLSTP
jgi:N-acetylneuraminic acid mutarotase